MQTRKPQSPADRAELEAKVDAWFRIQENAFKEIARIGALYRVELERDDVGHNGRLSKLEDRLRRKIDAYANAKQKQGQLVRRLLATPRS